MCSARNTLASRLLMHLNKVIIAVPETNSRSTKKETFRTMRAIDEYLLLQAILICSFTYLKLSNYNIYSFSFSERMKEGRNMKEWRNMVKKIGRPLNTQTHLDIVQTYRQKYKYSLALNHTTWFSNGKLCENFPFYFKLCIGKDLGFIHNSSLFRFLFSFFWHFRLYLVVHFARR